MNPRRLLLLVVFMGLAAWGVQRLSDRADVPGAPPPRIEAGALLNGRAEDLVSVLVHRPDLSILHVQADADGVWQLHEPILDRAEDSVVQDLVRRVFLPSTLPLEAADSQRPLAELGLDVPGFEVQFTFADGRRQKLLVGVLNLQGHSYYALLDGQPLLVARTIIDILGRSAAQWRDRAVAVAAPRVSRLRWEPTEGQGFAMQRGGLGWRLTAPLQAQVDPQRLSAIERLLGARCESLPDDVTPAATQEEMAERGGRLILWRKTAAGEERQQVLFYFHGVVFDPQRRYLMPVAPPDFAVLELSPDSLRSRRLLNMEPGHIVSMRILRDSTETVLRQGAKGWARKGGASLSAAGRQRALQLVRFLATMEGQELASPPADPLWRSIRMSRSLDPVERGSYNVVYLTQEDGRSLVAVGGNTQFYLVDRDLEADVRLILGD